MEVVQSLDPDKWRDFVASHPNGQVFHTPEMYEVFANAKRHDPKLWATVDRDGKVLSLMQPIYVSTFDGLLGRFTARSIAYGSVLYLAGPEGLKALAKMLSTYRRRMAGPVLFTELRNLSDLDGAREVVEQCGFAYEEHLNYLIDLQRPAEEILQSIGSRTRKNLRHALRQGKVLVEEVSDRQKLGVVYDLLQSTYENARLPLADRSLFDSAFDFLYPKGMVRYTLATVDSAPAAVSVDLLYKDVMYGWYGGTDRAYNSFLPNELLTWHLLEWGATHGYRVYDFGGAGKPDEHYGVRDFKAKFGGKLVSYGRNTCVHTPHFLQLSRFGYAAYRRLYGQLHPAFQEAARSDCSRIV
jgi:serine/alanine adding enzyme